MVDNFIKKYINLDLFHNIHLSYLENFLNLYGLETDDSHRIYFNKRYVGRLYYDSLFSVLGYLDKRKDVCTLSLERVPKPSLVIDSLLESVNTEDLKWLLNRLEYKYSILEIEPDTDNLFLFIRRLLSKCEMMKKDIEYVLLDTLGENIDIKILIRLLKSNYILCSADIIHRIGGEDLVES